MINIMPELTPVFTAYEALVAEADAVFARVGEMHPDCVTCKPGCVSLLIRLLHCTA